MASFVLVTAGLVALDLVSWLRTAPVRGGRTLSAGDPPTGAYSFSTSRATFLPSVAGLAAGAWGLAGLHPGGGLPIDLVVVMVGAGAFIVVAGLVARVTNVRADWEGLVMTLARRPPFHVSWDDLQVLVPPASPLGGWRLEDGRGKRSTLMPSDVWGHEELLELIVVRTDLRFDGRSWSRTVRKR